MKKPVIFLLSFLLSAALYAQTESNINFHSFAWGTSVNTFRARMGNPAFIDNSGMFQALLYENVPMAGYRAYMVAYFSANGLEGGMYYFDNPDILETMKCYDAVQKELVAHFGPTPPPPAGRYEEILREMRVYETCWILPGGYIHLKVNLRSNDPVTLWISFPTLTGILDG